MGNCTEKSAGLQKYFKNHKSAKLVDASMKPPPPLVSGLEGSVSNLSVSSTPRQSRHTVSDYFKNRRADSLPRHLSHIRTLFKQNSEEKKSHAVMPISKSSPNNFRNNVNNVESRPNSQEINNIKDLNVNQFQRNSVVGRIRQASLRISTSDSSTQSKKRHSDIITSLPTSNANNNNLTPTPSKRIVLIAMFDYHARTNEELSLRKSEKMYLLNEFDPDWWLVESIEKGDKGYIPSNFVAVEGSLESRDWFIKNISRKDSERLLLLQCNTQGTFLVRQSETSEGALSLSVRDIEPGGRGSVKHYKLRSDAEGNMWWISKKMVFTSLDALISAYSITTQSNSNNINSTGGGSLCCRLTRACLRPSPITADLSYRTKGEWWEIPRSQLNLVEKLGSGQFGEVWRALWNNTTWVAVKSLRAQSGMSPEEFLKEARTMKALVHPRLVQLYGVCREKTLDLEENNQENQIISTPDNNLTNSDIPPTSPLFIVTELMSQGSLLVYLRDGAGHTLDMRILIDLMAQIASGMAYIEREGYIHRDLAARNILVGDNYTCKVADFGLARMTGGCAGGLYEAREGTKFPIKWTAPEAAKLGRFTIKSDVWSFGIVLYEIVTRGQVPYPSMTNVETLTEVENGYRMPCTHECPEKVYQVMQKTWEKNPDDRPTFEYLCQFFENYYVLAEPSYKLAAQQAAQAANLLSGTTTTHDNNIQNHHHHQQQQHNIRQHLFRYKPEPELTAL